MLECERQPRVGGAEDDDLPGVDFVRHLERRTERGLAGRARALVQRSPQRCEHDVAPCVNHASHLEPEPLHGPAHARALVLRMRDCPRELDAGEPEVGGMLDVPDQIGRPDARTEERRFGLSVSEMRGVSKVPVRLHERELPSFRSNAPGAYLPGTVYRTGWNPTR